MRTVRKGMWVRYNGKVGIAHVGEVREKDGGVRMVEEFHQVNAKGATDLVVVAPFSEMTQARFTDIPKTRAGKLDAATAKRRFGYA